MFIQEINTHVDCAEHVSELLRFDVTRLIVTVEQALAINSVVIVQEKMWYSSIAIQERLNLAVYFDGPV